MGVEALGTPGGPLDVEAIVDLARTLGTGLPAVVGDRRLVRGVDLGRPRDRRRGGRRRGAAASMTPSSVELSTVLAHRVADLDDADPVGLLAPRRCLPRRRSPSGPTAARETLVALDDDDLALPAVPCRSRGSRSVRGRRYRSRLPPRGRRRAAGHPHRRDARCEDAERPWPSTAPVGASVEPDWWLHRESRFTPGDPRLPTGIGAAVAPWLGWLVAPIQIAGWTAEPGAPEPWDPDDGPAPADDALTHALTLLMADEADALALRLAAGAALTVAVTAGPADPAARRLSRCGDRGCGPGRGGTTRLAGQQAAVSIVGGLAGPGHGFVVTGGVDHSGLRHRRGAHHDHARRPSGDGRGRGRRLRRGRFVGVRRRRRLAGDRGSRAAAVAAARSRRRRGVPRRSRRRGGRRRSPASWRTGPRRSTIPSCAAVALALYNRVGGGGRPGTSGSWRERPAGQHRRAQDNGGDGGSQGSAWRPTIQARRRASLSVSTSAGHVVIPIADAALGHHLLAAEFSPHEVAGPLLGFVAEAQIHVVELDLALDGDGEGLAGGIIARSTPRPAPRSPSGPRRLEPLDAHGDSSTSWSAVLRPARGRCRPRRASRLGYWSTTSPRSAASTIVTKLSALRARWVSTWPTVQPGSRLARCGLTGRRPPRSSRASSAAWAPRQPSRSRRRSRSIGTRGPYPRGNLSAMQIAMVGLGRMGANMVRRLHARRPHVRGLRRQRRCGRRPPWPTGPSAPARSPNWSPRSSAPRHVWIMVPAAFVGGTVDQLGRPARRRRRHHRRRQLLVPRRCRPGGAAGGAAASTTSTSAPAAGCSGSSAGYCLMVGGDAEVGRPA